MKLSTEAKKLINKSTDCQYALAKKLDVSLYSIQRYVRENNEDNELTKASCLEIISEHTKLTQDQILETATA